MFIKRIMFICFVLTVSLFGGLKNLSLHKALKILDKNNLELKISRFNTQMKAYEIKVAKGHSYGKLDASVTAIRSNDAGNVFGFKLQSREATFGDFGFSEFDMSGQTNPLPVAPQSLNHPEERNHYQTNISYILPLYTGGKLSEYERMSEAMYRMSIYDTQKLLNEKVFQIKKTFYDISLVSNYISNLSKIIQNIKRLESIVINMKNEGYAQDIDVLEVQARATEVESMHNQAILSKVLAYQFLSFILNTEVSSINKVNDMVSMPKLNKEELESNNIDMQKALLGLKVTQMAINVEKSNFLPNVGAFAEYGMADDALWNEFRDKDAYTIGAKVQWNIFNGGMDDANLERAKVNYMKVKEQVLLAKSAIFLKVKKLKTEIYSANADIKSFKKQLSFARKVYKNYKARYKEGIVPISDVLIKQSKELEMLLKLLTVKNKRNTKVFELHSLVGTNKRENI